jgi:GNAT superfamily N-acetyltransferase
MAKSISPEGQVPLIIIQLPAGADRKSFESTNPILNRYFHEQVGQDTAKHVCTCFVLTEDSKTCKGYYTLSSYSIPRISVPEDMQKKLKLPRYQDLPVILLGRLAVDKKAAGKGFGERLLMDALHRAAGVSRTAIAAIAVIVDPIDQSAAAFYAKYGFLLLPDSGKMFLPMKTIAGLFG